jgi:N6-L-threonylcarbamoyladenine synthase
MVWRDRTPSAFDLSADSSLPVTETHVPASHDELHRLSE